MRNLELGNKNNEKNIFIHGLGHTAASWKQVISLIKEKEENVCPDLSKISANGEITYPELYRAFSDICNKMEGKVNLCGLSLGGVLALNYAIDYPAKVNSLVLIAAQYRMPKRLLSFQNMIFQFMPKSMFIQMGFGKQDFLNLCKTMADLDFSNLLYKIKCPVLVICGEKDHANKKAAKELAGLLECAKFQMIPKVGHEVNVEVPQQLAGLLDEFWDRG